MLVARRWAYGLSRVFVAGRGGAGGDMDCGVFGSELGPLWHAVSGARHVKEVGL